MMISIQVKTFTKSHQLEHNGGNIFIKLNTRGTKGNGKKFHQIYVGTNYYKFSFFTMIVLM